MTHIAITASFTPHPVGPILSAWLDLLGFAPDLEWAPYGQVFQSLLDHDGALRRNRGGVGIVLVRRTDLFPDPATGSEVAAQLAMALRACVDASGCPIIIGVCPSAPVNDGDGDAADANLVAQLRGIAGVDAISATDIATLYPTATVFDHYADHEGAVPYTEEYFAALATMIARRLRVAKREPKKVIVVDCDDTLWGGVVGEVGTTGVVLDAPRLALQRFLLEQRELGVLIAVVSKNNERDALAVFEQRPEMLLRVEHLTTWRINWNQKSENIHDIARALSLGVDSFVLLDDDAYVCAEARERCAGLTAIQLPDDPATLAQFVRHLWPLDRGSVTAEDRQRAEAYRLEAQRDHARREMSHEDFLASLELDVALQPLADENIARVAQLTVRTNQFNATGVRRTEADVRNMSARGLECAVVHVRDRFGDYGLTGTVIYSVDNATLVVETLLLSCRVLGRGVEQRLMAQLAEIARTRGATELSIPYIPTPKNAPYAAFFTSLPTGHLEEHGTERRCVLDLETASTLRVAAAAPETPVEAAPAIASAASESFDAREIAIQLSCIDDIRARFGKARPAEAGEDPISFVAAVFCEVLDVGNVGLDDDFFDLGGDSIAALRVLTRIRDHVGVEIGLHELFRMDPSVRVLAGEITKRRAAGSTSTRPSYAPTTITRARATVAQEYFYYLDRDDHDPTSYYSTSVLTIASELDEALLARAYRELVAYHSVFRTAFEEVDGVLYQQVLPLDEARAADLEIVDRSHVNREQWRDEFEAAAAELAANDYDLSRAGGLVYGRLLRFAHDQYGLVLLLHHIASDGGSNNTFRKQLCDGYSRLRRGSPSALPDESRPLQHIDFAVAQEHWVSTPVGHAQQELWTKRLREVAGVVLEGDFPRADIDAHRDAVPLGITADRSHPPESLKLAPEIYETVLKAAQSARTTPFVVFSTGLVWLLHRRSRQNDISLQTTYAPRPHDPALETMIGCLTSWTLLRVDLTGVQRFRDAMARMQEVVTAQHESGPPHDFYRMVPHAARRAVFNYLPIPAAKPEMPADLVVTPVPWHFPPWKRTWDLHLTVVDDSTKAGLVWTGFEKLFHRETVVALLNEYLEILSTAADER